MTDHPPSPVARPRAAVAGRGAAVLAGWYATALVGFALWVSVLPAGKTDGSCDGIGFGCTPNARDGVILVGMIYGAPLLAAGPPATS